jgi:hypothetical protein
MFISSHPYDRVNRNNSQVTYSHVVCESRVSQPFHKKHSPYFTWSFQDLPHSITCNTVAEINIHNVKASQTCLPATSPLLAVCQTFTPLALPHVYIFSPRHSPVSSSSPRSQLRFQLQPCPTHSAPTSLRYTLMNMFAPPKTTYA